MGATVGFMHGIAMEMLRFPGTSSSVWAPKIVALMGLSPFDLPSLQRERLYFPSGQLPQAVLSPSAHAMRPANQGCCRERNAVLQLSAEVFLSVFHVKPTGRKLGGHTTDQTLVVCPFPLVLKKIITLCTKHSEVVTS